MSRFLARGLKAGGQKGGVERFGEEVVGAKADTSNDVLSLIGGGKHDDGNVLCRSLALNRLSV